MSCKKSDYLRSPCYEELKLATQKEGREGPEERGQRWREILTKPQPKSQTSKWRSHRGYSGDIRHHVQTDWSSSTTHLVSCWYLHTFKPSQRKPQTVQSRGKLSQYALNEFCPQNSEYNKMVIVLCRYTLGGLLCSSRKSEQLPWHFYYVGIIMTFSYHLKPFKGSSSQRWSQGSLIRLRRYFMPSSHLTSSHSAKHILNSNHIEPN